MAYTPSGSDADCHSRLREGGPIEEIRPGDVVLFPAGEKHWHGAAPTTAMTHIAIQEALDGKVVAWMEKVTDTNIGVRYRVADEGRYAKSEPYTDRAMALGYAGTLGLVAFTPRAGAASSVPRGEHPPRADAPRP